MSIKTPAALAEQDLVAQLGPDHVRSSDAPGKARVLWNGAVEHRPALIVSTGTPADVQATVLAARRYGLALSVWGGGHDWYGRALRPDGLVIDLSRMGQVTVDETTAIATVGGGALSRDVIAAGAPHGLVAATGTVGGVGMAGLTLGGGYGPLNGRFGLALDNLIGAEVVLADGRLVTTDATHEPELYWAIRGGGGNFGVVTSLRVQLHHVPQLLAGLIMYPWSQAADVWEGLRGFLDGAPDELTVQSGILPGPDGSPVLFLSPTWSGDSAQGERVIDELRALGAPVLDQVGSMTYGDMLALFDAHVVTGRHYELRTRSVTGFTPAVIAALVQAGTDKTSVPSGIAIHHFHGASSRVPVERTAFGVRQNHFVVEILAAWEPGDPAEADHRGWTRSVSDALAPVAIPGGYANLLSPEDQDQIEHAYGPNTARLQAAKARFDPDGVFSAIAIPRSDATI